MRSANMKALCLLVGVLSVCEAKSVAEDSVSLEDAKRDPKLFSVFQIIQFPNDACNASSSGLMGTCYTAAECSSKNLTADGTCASGFGTCCVATLGSSQDKCATGTETISANNTYLVNPGFPNGVSTSGCASARQGTVATYNYKIGKFSSTVTQLRFDFLMYETDAPSSGDCANGTMTITGADSVTSKVLPTNLCGTLTGQHMYISVADLATTGALTVSIALTSAGNQKWQILVRQFESSQTEFLAPRGCLQYFRENSGTLKSFNSNGGSGEILNNHNYAICIADVANFCDVALTSSTFDLDAGTSLTLGGTSYTGTTFGTSGAATWAFMGPYVATVMTTSANSGMNSGFEIGYLLLPC